MVLFSLIGLNYYTSLPIEGITLATKTLTSNAYYYISFLIFKNKNG